MNKVPKKRPVHQKILLPLLGIILFLIGIIGFILPILPGFVFIIISIPLICCVDSRAERWAEGKKEALKQWWEKRRK